MAEYTKVFENPYPNGWEDLPSENTPITAEALQEHTDAIEHLEEYLEENPIMDGTDVQWNQIVESGEEIAEITIDGETTKVYAPKGGGGGGEAFVEMTKAEYDALPDTKLTDGVPRLITDYTEGSSGEIYDDTERVIGTWFGKPLYRKVKSYTNQAINNTIVLDIDNLDNADTFYIENVFLVDKSSAPYRSIPFTSTTATSNSVIGFRLRSDNKVQITGNDTYGANVNRVLYIVYCYTKVGD